MSWLPVGATCGAGAHPADEEGAPNCAGATVAPATAPVEVGANDSVDSDRLLAVNAEVIDDRERLDQERTSAALRADGAPMSSPPPPPPLVRP